MVDFRNPYTPGAGCTPRYLAGREDILSKASRLIEAAAEGYQTRSVVYYGLRGVGKTVLLNQLEGIADNRNLLKKHIEVKEASNFIRSLSIAANGFARSLSFKEAVKDKTGKLWSVLRSFSMTWNQEDKSLSVEMKDQPMEAATAGTGDLANDLTELLVTLGNYAQQCGTAICFFIDEIQYAKEAELEALITADHRINQLGLPVVFFCAGLPKILKAMGDAKSYTERLFEFVQVDSLTPDAARDAIVIPADDLGVSYTEEAVELILQATMGYPYFIQEMCSTIWENHDRRSIDADAVKANIDETNRKLDRGFFQVRYDRCTPTEKNFMFAMVQCGNLPCTIANVAEIMGRSTQSIAIHRSNLISKGLIYATGHGEIDFTVPQFDLFLRRVRPEL